MSADVRVFGIRHHGPGSARTLVRALKAYQPDAVLVEGPPDADALINLVVHGDMRPPVALLVYDVATPSNATFFPFAEFSPEWQALQYARSRNAHAAFMDLPVTVRLPLDHEARDNEADVRLDPLGELARAAGFDDGERWWESMVEHRQDGGAEVFDAVLEAMEAMRQDHEDSRIESIREAHMRRVIRDTKKAGHERIAVVCGAWHAPALATSVPAARDQALLKGLKKTKVEATWVPWTNRRLSFASGYGAGVRSPGWYEHLWRHDDAIVERWLSRVARLLRDEDLDASSAQVIDAVRLAATLAAMRNRSLPGLDELGEATESVLCAGDPTPMTLVRDRLIVGDRLGEVPEESPVVPLQRDLEQTIKRLRMRRSADDQDVDLDLRKPLHLERSHLLHRLRLLDIPWGEQRADRAGTGSFRETWVLQWEPEYEVRVIEAAQWGNIVADAARGLVLSRAAQATDMTELTRLVDDLLLADLPDATETLVRAIESKAATETDVGHLMDALAPLARVLRYGNVRSTDTAMVENIVKGLLLRTSLGLPAACRSLNEEAAAMMVGRIAEVHAALASLESLDRESWHEALARVAASTDSAPGPAGKACRLLLDADIIDAGTAGERLSFELSRASDPAAAGAWLEGFLVGSGMLLLHDDALWNVIDEWLCGLSGEHFDQIVPVLRRTFATFAPGERRMLGERARSGVAESRAVHVERSIDLQRAEASLDVVRHILGASTDG